MNILIGNIISLVAAVFLAASCAIKERKMIFYFQAINCIILAVASIFFGAYAGITTLVISAIRNIIVAHDKYSNKLMYLFLCSTIILGLVTNNRGAIGLLPVIATVQYTICLKVFKSLLYTRLSIWVNTAMWVAYSLIIYDFSTAFMDSISLVTVTISIISMFIKNS